MRLRSKKIKREHSMIDGLFALLQRIQQISEIQTIIPGRIKPVKGQKSQIQLLFTTVTDSGLKYIAKSDRAVQEVFIVTDERELVKGMIEELKVKS